MFKLTDVAGCRRSVFFPGSVFQRDRVGVNARTIIGVVALASVSVCGILANASLLSMGIVRLPTVWRIGMCDVALLVDEPASTLLALKLFLVMHYPVKAKWSSRIPNLISILDVEMAFRTEQSNVSRRHDGADYTPIKGKLRQRGFVGQAFVPAARPLHLAARVKSIE